MKTEEIKFEVGKKYKVNTYKRLYKNSKSFRKKMKEWFGESNSRNRHLHEEFKKNLGGTMKCLFVDGEHYLEMEANKVKRKGSGRESIRIKKDWIEEEVAEGKPLTIRGRWYVLERKTDFPSKIGDYPIVTGKQIGRAHV